MPSNAKSIRRWLARGLVVSLLIAAAVWFFRSEKSAEVAGTRFVAKRGPMEITVLEGGTVEALESQEIKSEVHGETKILTIVEEGYFVTQDDIDKKKLLVELDSKQLMDRQTEQELQYQNAKSSLTGAQANYEIQANQNASDLKAAELVVKFARMDFERYLGQETAEKILKEIKLEEVIKQVKEEAARRDDLDAEEAKASAEAKQEEGKKPDDAPKPEEGKDAKAGTEAMPEGDGALPKRPEVTVDFSKYADPKMLGDGEAGQRLRTLHDATLLARRDVMSAQTDFEGTKRLFERDFVTKNQLDSDETGLERKKVSQASAETAEALFIKYEFPKQAETYLSGYLEALQKLIRANRLASSKISQTEGALRAAEEMFRLQTRKRDEIREQIGKCKICAEKPGMVVYGAGEQQYWREERIEEGATVRERQIILTIPDLRQMVVKVKVHESFVKRVQKDQHARMRVDAYPNVQLEGEVQKIALLPDTQNRWMNPDMKLYETKVLIKGAYDWLKPGMTVETEIVVQELPDVVQVPLPAVSSDNGQQVCFVVHGSELERRVVETGEFNESMIELKKGVTEGETVVLRAPLKTEEDQKNEGKKDEKTDKKSDGEKRREKAPKPEDGAAKAPEAKQG